jgi:hypothetical protein
MTVITTCQNNRKSDKSSHEKGKSQIDYSLTTISRVPLRDQMILQFQEIF